MLFRSPLLFVGQHPQELRDAGVKPSEGVSFLGYVSDQELAALYASCHGFVLASLYEGFGLPVLEAMQYDIPVACSNIACLPEVAGSAACFFDPLSSESIADSLQRICGDAELRSNLVAAGKENLQRFSWQKCADQTAQVFWDVANSSV